MRIGIFGGSFNPPHLRHKEIIEYLLKNNYVDKLIVVPTGKLYEYKNNLIDNKYRYEMLQIISKSYKNVIVSDYEFKDEVVHSFDTLSHYSKLYPQDEICFICGTDNLSYMDKWYRGLELLRKYTIIAINRNHDNFEAMLNKYQGLYKKIIKCDLIESPISSTTIREKIANNEDTTGLLEPNVALYIKENSLYKNI